MKHSYGIVDNEKVLVYNPHLFLRTIDLNFNNIVKKKVHISVRKIWNLLYYDVQRYLKNFDEIHFNSLEKKNKK